MDREDERGDPDHRPKNGASVAAGDRAFEGHEAEYARNPWDIHPTDEGYETLAQAFAEATA